jgi:hypothetical protein
MTLFNSGKYIAVWIFAGFLLVGCTTTGQSGPSSDRMTKLERHELTLENNKDHHVGYYYPALSGIETYGARIRRFPEASRFSRIGFVTGLTSKMLKNPYEPGFAIFAKGADAAKMIIINLDDARYNSLYRLRALLAMLTAVARTTPIFRDTNMPENLTFLDLLHMMGFTQVTISNGHDVAQRIFITGD